MWPQTRRERERVKKNQNDSKYWPMPQSVIIDASIVISQKNAEAHQIVKW